MTFHMWWWSTGAFFVWSTEKARNMVKPYYLPFFEEAYQELFQSGSGVGEPSDGTKGIVTLD